MTNVYPTNPDQLPGLDFKDWLASSMLDHSSSSLAELGGFISFKDYVAENDSYDPTELMSKYCGEASIFFYSLPLTKRLYLEAKYRYMYAEAMTRVRDESQ